MFYCSQQAEEEKHLNELLPDTPTPCTLNMKVPPTSKANGKLKRK